MSRMSYLYEVRSTLRDKAALPRLSDDDRAQVAEALELLTELLELADPWLDFLPTAAARMFAALALKTLIRALRAVKTRLGKG